MESKAQHKCTFLQNRNRLTDRESRPVVAKGEEGLERVEREVGISRGKLGHTASKDMPAALHREPSSASCDKSQQKRV